MENNTARQPTSLRNFGLKFLEFLKLISVGKFDSILTYKGTSSHSSVVGGVLTFISALILLFASFIIIADVFSTEHKNLEYRQVPMAYVEYDSDDIEILHPGEQVTFQELSQILKNYQVNLIIADQSFPDCKSYWVSFETFKDIRGVTTVPVMNLTTSVLTHSFNECLFQFSAEQIDKLRDIIGITLDTKNIYQMYQQILAAKFKLIVYGLQKGDVAQTINMEDKKVDILGSNRQYLYSRFIPIGCQMIDQMRLIRYSEEEGPSVFSFTQNAPTTANFHTEQQILLNNLQASFTSQPIEIMLGFTYYSQHTRLYPDTIFMGLIKIGGLLALFRISIFLAFFHRYNFEKNLNQASLKRQNTNNDVEKVNRLQINQTQDSDNLQSMLIAPREDGQEENSNLFSFEKFIELAQGYQNLKETISRLEISQTKTQAQNAAQIEQIVVKQDADQRRAVQEYDILQREIVRLKEYNEGLQEGQRNMERVKQEQQSFIEEQCQVNKIMREQLQDYQSRLAKLEIQQ
ncbi:hypothetical protein FGO68_gene16245 [Halteria grandinella]|uniref:Transmembrane protein n=1 Tax=Halteria grandinella TaxID=5974 RepID=A0A8J8T291_HALGN|nr:hypothetical protein FGO68_gene16245 [Halteria grandinella]